MKKTNLAARLIFIMPLLFSSCATETLVLKRGYDFNKVERIAVLPFSSSIYSPETGTMVSELFVKYLLKAGYNVVERNELNAILKEYQLSRSNLINPEHIKQFKLSGIDAIVTGSITKNIAERNIYEDDGNIRFIAAQAGVTCRMIDVETGEILWAGSNTYDGMTQQTAFDYLASSIIRKFVSDLERPSLRKVR